MVDNNINNNTNNNNNKKQPHHLQHPTIKQPEPEAEKILEGGQELGYRLRATVMPPPKRDKKGNILDMEGKINKPRGKVGLITNPKKLAYLKSINPNDERVIRSEAVLKKLEQQGRLKQVTGRVLTLAEREERRRMATEAENKRIRKTKELQKKIRFGIQGKKYEVPAEFKDDPDLNDELRWADKINKDKEENAKLFQKPQYEDQKENEVSSGAGEQQVAKSNQEGKTTINNKKKTEPIMMEIKEPSAATPTTQEQQPPQQDNNNNNNNQEDQQQTG